MQRLNLIKRFHKKKIGQVFGVKVQDCKDGSGLKLIYEQDARKSKLAVLFASDCETIKRNCSKLYAIPVKYDISGVTVSL